MAGELKTEAVCRYCGDPIVWHEGNGGQWLGAEPGRDWMTCGGMSGSVGIRHQPSSLPDLRDPEEIESWLTS